MDIQENEENKRRLTADFKATFDNPVGQRVLNYIMRDILKTKAIYGPGPGERAVYGLALHDVALQINSIINRKFEDDRPVVKTTQQFRHAREAAVTQG